MGSYKLGELIQIYNGTKYSHLNSGDIPLYGSGGIMSYVDDYLYDGEALLLPRKGSLSNIMYSKGKIWTVDTMYYATTNEKVNPYYLYSYLSILSLEHLDSGSTLPSMTKSAYGNIEIKLPKIECQNKVAKLLQRLDAKIELNNKINQELEAMAKMLYDYWFIQFDFPNEHGKPYKSSGGEMVYNKELKREIPDGWEVKTLAKITSVSNDSINPMLSPDKEFKHYSIPTFDSIKTYGTEKGENIRSNKFKVTQDDVLVSKLNPWFSRVIYPVNEPDLICSTEFVVWRTANSYIKNYLYILARGEHFISHCTQSATGTSNSHRRVNPTVMMRYKVAFHSDLVEMYGKTTEPWIKMSINKQKENKQLKKLRGWLIPMLMNEQVTIN